MIAGADEVKTLAGRMMNTTPPISRDFAPLEAVEAALDWWREAGVDTAFHDEPESWLKQPEAEQAVTAPKPKLPPAPVRSTPLERALAPDEADKQIGGPRDTWPNDLTKLREWWMTEPSLSPGALDTRLPPRGAAGARLLVLVGQPERDDGESLLSGGAGHMLTAILRAMGIGEHEAYLASALPAPMALPEWDRLAARGLGDVTCHHIAIAAPQRVLVFGRAMAPLFGAPPDAARTPFLLDCGGTNMPFLLAPELAELARSAGRRQRFWQSWLDWTR
ncbi:hypothetical protein FEV51_02250 [Qipengyuania marisflavi]|uniref:Uracil-DNA glycosylase-like domain-containing protein n=1 Tax=Qipengyuania marisflavi TaxID=2486356 RepID=A0A5S3P952_9SPHN|nr:hypothetical protein FEV51_02250 [Qipengyuania marisflavi]